MVTFASGIESELVQLIDQGLDLFELTFIFDFCLVHLALVLLTVRVFSEHFNHRVAKCKDNFVHDRVM